MEGQFFLSFFFLPLLSRKLACEDSIQPTKSSQEYGTKLEEQYGSFRTETGGKKHVGNRIGQSICMWRWASTLADSSSEHSWYLSLPILQGKFSEERDWDLTGMA